MYRSPEQLKAYANEEGGTISQDVLDRNVMNVQLNFGFALLCSIAFFVVASLLLAGSLEVRFYLLLLHFRIDISFPTFPQSVIRKHVHHTFHKL